MNKKYIFLVGIPASGKSTFAIDFISKHQEFVRWNRDDIREMFMPGHNEHWYNEFHFDRVTKENIITEMGKTLLETALSVLDDNTNLNKKFLLHGVKIAQEANFDVEVWFLKDSENLQLCVQRDAQRDRVVGEEVIKNFYERYVSLKTFLELEKEELNIKIKEI